MYTDSDHGKSTEIVDMRGVMYGPLITEADKAMVWDALDNCFYGRDAFKYIELFEQKVAEYHDRRYAIFVPNCTLALDLLLRGLGVGKGDEVIVPECTWGGGVAPIHGQGSKIVFADIDPVSWCLTPASIEACVTSKTKAVVLVDLYGNMPDMDGIREVCDKHGIYLIEDIAEAMGSRYKNVRAGKFGVGAVCSFQRTKVVTSDEGGMLLVDSEDIYRRCKFLSDNGRSPDDSRWLLELSGNFLSSNVLAALGYSQFLRLEEHVNKKRWIWNTYKKLLADVRGFQLNPEPEFVYNSVWCTTLVFDKDLCISSKRARKAFADRGQPSRAFFYPLSSMPAFAGYLSADNGGEKNSPVAFDISSRAINLPSALCITQNQIEQIVDTLRNLRSAV